VPALPVVPAPPIVPAVAVAPPLPEGPPVSEPAHAAANASDKTSQDRRVCIRR